MTRAVPEWIGRAADSVIPPRVRLRVFERDGGICQCGCEIIIFPGDKWEVDHVVAMINGGENRESNLRTMLASHHKVKTAADVKEKARVSRKRMKHLGLRPARKKIQSRGFDKASPQRSASRPIQRRQP